MSAYFDWFRAGHIIFVIAWMAGMLMLPRLFVYQFRAERGSVFDTTMIEAQARLMAIILNPAMVLTWVFGLLMLWAGLEGGRYPWPFELWLWAKLVLVLALTGVHGMFSAARRKFAQHGPSGSEKHWRLMNELPFIIAIAVVLLAVLEPR